MAKPGTPVNSAKRPSAWRRALMLAAFTLAAGVAIVRLSNSNWLVVEKTIPLSQLPDAALEPRLRAMIRKGHAGLASVVEALGAEREPLRRAALWALHQEIDHCSMSMTDDSAAQIDELARWLCQYSGGFDADALTSAAALAERITALPTRPGGNSQRIRNCHVVLAAEAQRRMREQASRPNLSTKRAADGQTVSPTPFASGRVPVNIEPLAGGGMATRPSDAVPRRLPEQLSSRAAAIGVSSGQTQNPTRQSPWNWAASRQMEDGKIALAANTPVVAADRPRSNDAHESLTSSPTVPTQESSSAASEAPRPLPDDLARLLDLDEQLRSDHVTPGVADKAELARLGIDETQLSLARGAVDANPRVRQHVVESLAASDSVDRRSWLLWLSHDPHADVRRAAITLLATSSDPGLQRRVREAAESDADAKVREQARLAGAAESRP